MVKNIFPFDVTGQTVIGFIRSKSLLIWSQYSQNLTQLGIPLPLVLKKFSENKSLEISQLWGVFQRHILSTKIHLLNSL